MSHGADWTKENGDVPYEPLGAERPLLATALRAHIMEQCLDGSEDIARFGPGGRFKVRLPSGEKLLRCTMFDERGKFGRALLIRAFVSIPCPPDEPYRDVVEFAFAPEEWETPRAAIDKEIAAEQAGISATRRTARYQLAAALVAGAALVIGEAASGIVSDTWKQAQNLMDRIEGVNEKTRRDPPAQPPIVIPGNSWGWSQR